MQDSRRGRATSSSSSRQSTSRSPSRNRTPPPIPPEPAWITAQRRHSMPVGPPAHMGTITPPLVNAPGNAVGQSQVPPPLPAMPPWLQRRRTAGSQAQAQPHGAITAPRQTPPSQPATPPAMSSPDRTPRQPRPAANTGYMRMPSPASSDLRPLSANPSVAPAQAPSTGAHYIDLPGSSYDGGRQSALLVYRSGHSRSIPRLEDVYRHPLVQPYMVQLTERNDWHERIAYEFGITDAINDLLMTTKSKPRF